MDATKQRFFGELRRASPVVVSNNPDSTCEVRVGFRWVRREKVHSKKRNMSLARRSMLPHHHDIMDCASAQKIARTKQRAGCFAGDIQGQNEGTSLILLFKCFFSAYCFERSCARGGLK